mgnify:CR=1 FL=1|jgi:phosphonate degradation associated HDIG domain protein
MNIIDQVFESFRRNGDALYDGGEAVTQTQHALQAAYFAEEDTRADTLVAAALLHDYGHVMESSQDTVGRDLDGRHELVGSNFLGQHFVAAITEPGKLHVAAKRYLCATESSYFDSLSPVSVRSLELQGGPFTADQIKAFENNPHYKDAVQVRRYDERAKDPALTTPDLEHYRRYLETGLLSPK